MTWIKENYDRFILALIAATLAACAAVLFINARDFGKIFDAIQGKVIEKSDIVPVDMVTLNSNREKLAQPFIWKLREEGEGSKKRSLPTFVSPPLIEQGEPDGKGGFTYKLVDPLEGNMVHPPIPNDWLMKYDQDLLASNVLSQDTDGDGFTNLDEYQANPQTSPKDKNSHPPYYTKLYLGRFVRIPFRLLFAALNGDTMLINTLDIEDAPTQFLTVGKMIAGTRFKITKLEKKTAKIDGINKDVSEATLLNVDNNETIILPKNQEIDSPTTYAELAYVWAGSDFGGQTKIKVNKNQEFTIKPETNVKYKALRLSDTEAVVLKEDENKEITLKLLPRK